LARVDQPMSRGSHRLIREGAQLVESPEEILAEILPKGARATATRAGDPLPGRPAPSAAAQRVLAGLRGETCSADEIAARLDMDAREVLVALVELELEELVVRAPGGVYRLVT